MELFSLHILARVATIAVLSFLSPGKPEAGQMLLLHASYVRPVRSSVGGTLLLSHGDVKSFEGGRSIIVGGSVGQGGMQVHAGMQVWEGLAQPIGDFRAVVTRTWDSPRGASANSTYVGGEVGVGLLARLSVGYAKRISGPSTGDDHLLTWGVGLQIPVWVH